VQVTGLPLTLGSVDYYQVYFSVLAALGPRDATYCPRAQAIIGMVRASGYQQQRPDITANISAAELECAPGALTPPTATATSRSVFPTQIPTSTPYPTATSAP